MKTDSKAMFANMPPVRLFFTAAMPGMISMFAMCVYTILEGMFVGRLLGETALAAVNIAFPVVMINFSLADLVGVGSSVPISVALGRRDEKSANNIFSCAVLLIISLSLLMGAAMFVLARPLSVLMGASEQLLPMCQKYIRTYALFSPAAAMLFAADNFLRISGYIKPSMLLNVFASVGTIGLLALFLLVFKMDIVGAALAPSIALSVSAVLAMTPFVFRRALLKFTRPRLSLDIVKKIAACGSPTFLNNIAGRITSILMNITLMRLGERLLGASGGTTAVAAYSILMYANETCQPLIYGMSDSLAPALGFNWGAENYKRVKDISKCVFAGAFTVGVLSCVITFFLYRPICSLFVASDSPGLFELCSHALRLFSVTYLLRWFSIAAQSFLSAIEKPFEATVLSVCVALVFPAASLVILSPLKLNGIWLNMFASSAMAAVLGALLIKRVWKRVSHRA